MQKKRLENALNAGKLIRLGFNVNNSKPETLNLLYTVNCTDNNVCYSNDQATSVKDPDSDTETDDSSLTSKLDKTIDYEKIEILSLQFNENQNILATGDSNGEVQIYDVFSGLPISVNEDQTNKKSNFDSIFSNKKISSSSGYNMPTICMKWHPYSNYSLNLLYYAHVNGLIGVMDKESFKKSIIIEEKDEISCIDFSLDGSCLASVGKDYTIKIYDSNINNSSTFNKVVKAYGCNNATQSNSFMTSISSALSSILSTSASSSSHTNRLQSVKFSNTSNDLLFTGGWDRTVKIWDKRTSNGFVDALHGPFICGSDAIDVNDNLVLTASWVKEKALDLWDIRTCKKVSNLPVINDRNDDTGVDKTTLSYKLNMKDAIVNEYLYACKFFSSSNQLNINSKNLTTNYSTVLACGSGTQSLHLIDYEQGPGKQHLASINCQSPLYCLDAIYSCSLIACGGMKKFFTVMGTSSSTK